MRGALTGRVGRDVISFLVELLGVPLHVGGGMNRSDGGGEITEGNVFIRSRAEGQSRTISPFPGSRGGGTGRLFCSCT